MKKIKRSIFALTFLMMVCIMLNPMKVMAAAEEDSITTVAAEGTKNSVKVSGTTGTDVVAVLIEIFDADNNVVTMETYPVTAQKYNATISFTFEEGKTYTAYVVNFNGSGDAKETTYTVPLPASTDPVKPTEPVKPADSDNQTATVQPNNTPTTKTPAANTGDVSSMMWYLLLAVGCVGITYGYFAKKMTKK